MATRVIIRNAEIALTPRPLLVVKKGKQKVVLPPGIEGEIVVDADDEKEVKIYEEWPNEEEEGG